VIRIVYTDSDCPSRYILSHTTAIYGRCPLRHLSSFLMETVRHEQTEITMSTRLHDSDRSAGKAKCHPEATAATIRALIFSIWSGPPREMAVAIFIYAQRRATVQNATGGKDAVHIVYVSAGNFSHAMHAPLGSPGCPCCYQ
jgi:hypothetical protein